MELLKILYERAGALNTYWNLYIVVALGCLTLLASGKDFVRRREIKLLLTVAFVLFAASNLNAIYDVNEQRRALLRLAEPPYVDAANASAPPPAYWLILFHSILDLSVVLAIWIVPWSVPSKHKDPK
jgi:hypothetical protein